MLRKTLVRIEGLKDSPLVYMDLPYPTLIGTRVLLDFLLRRKRNTRTEEARIKGDFQVKSCFFDLRDSKSVFVVTIESVGQPPQWRSIKNLPGFKRVLHPAISPRTPIR